MQSAMPNRTRISTPDLPYGGTWGLFCRRPVEEIINEQMEAIRSLWDRRLEETCAVAGGYSSITLVGHSYGGVLARKVAIIPCGKRPVPPSSPRSMRTASRANSPMSSGASSCWPASRADGRRPLARDWITTVKWGFFQALGEMVEWITGRGYTTFAIRRGSPLIQTRLQWLALVLRKKRAEIGEGAGNCEAVASVSRLPRHSAYRDDRRRGLTGRHARQHGQRECRLASYMEVWNSRAFRRHPNETAPG